MTGDADTKPALPDDQKYLDAFRERGEFPKIHDALFQLFLQEAKGKVFLDLGCSTGLLGQRILQQIAGSTVFGVDRDEDAHRRGELAGTKFPRYLVDVTREYRDFYKLLVNLRPQVVVARKCIAELFGSPPPIPDSHADPLFGDSWGKCFLDTLRICGVRQLFLEGRDLGRVTVNEVMTMSGAGDPGVLPPQHVTPAQRTFTSACLAMAPMT